MSSFVAYRVVQAWRVLIGLAAITHVAIGTTFFLGGNKLGEPFFSTIGRIPNPVWGAWAVISGLLIFLPLTRLPALVVTAFWYGTWGACLIADVVQLNGPYYAIPLYLLVIAMHFSFALIEGLERWEARQRKAAVAA